MIVKGRVHTFGDNIDTDVIIPARFLNVSDPEELKKHCMKDIDASFAERVEAGDIMVGLSNFGCGSSREHAPISIAACGVSLVIAKSFARIFYRNAINIGLPILECEKADEIKEGDILEVDLANGLIKNLTSGAEYETIGFPPFIEGIIQAGGLLKHIKQGMK